MFPPDKYPGKNPKDLGWHELVLRLKAWEEEQDADPQKREFAKLKRNPEDHTFNDDDLVAILAGIFVILHHKPTRANSV